MKLMASGVTNSAAITRSPSFSRSSSSTRMTILPALMSAMISVIGASALMLCPLIRVLRRVGCALHAVCLRWLAGEDARRAPKFDVLSRPDPRRPSGLHGLFLLPFEHALDVAGDKVDLQIDPAAGLQMLEVGHRHRVRDQVDPEVAPFDAVHGEADAIDGDRALLRDVAGDRRGG